MDMGPHGQVYQGGSGLCSRSFLVENLIGKEVSKAEGIHGAGVLLTGHLSHLDCHT